MTRKNIQAQAASLLPGSELPYLFGVGGAGDPPALLGDPPSGTGLMSAYSEDVLRRAALLPVPSGGSPDGTGESPVPPTLNRYELPGYSQISLREM